MALLSSRMSSRANGTHVEDLKDPEKVLFPTRNLVLISLRADESGDRIPFALFDDLPLNPGQGSAIDTSVSG
jgi:hypothetical protein